MKKIKNIKHSITWSFLALLLAQVSAFSDSEGHLYEPAINYLHSESFINGYPDGSFGPNRAINRAEFIKILMSSKFETQIKEEHNSLCFTDITNKEIWYVPYACLAKEKHIISGYSGGELRPAQDINFVEASKILANIYSPTQLPVDANTWYKPYVSYLLANNVVPALEIKQPNQKITRGQMVEMIYRLSLLQEGTLMNYLTERESIYGTEFYPTYSDFIERSGNLIYQIPYELTKPHNIQPPETEESVTEEQQDTITQEQRDAELQKDYNQVINLPHPGIKTEGGYISGYEEYISAAYDPSEENDIATAEDIISRVDNLKELINGERGSLELNTLDESEILDNSAQNLATHLVNNAFYGHMDKFGRKPQERAQYFGYSGGVAEIITWGSNGEDSSVDWWLNSEIHKNALLNPNFSHIGIGVAKEPFNKKYVFILVLGTSAE